MQFFIEYTENIEKKTLVYDFEEWSFITEPAIREINFDIVINTLNLTAVDADNKIVQVSGFCGLDRKMKSNYDVPIKRKGTLKILDKLVVGVGSYSISNSDFPVFVNVKTGWVCIGNPKKKGNAVEFVDNCVAVIGNDSEFISLWLKPQSLPQI